jgi:uncharacterized membrane protein YhaH (DUF805 family)
MTFQDAITTCFNKYAEFVGRARRSEYWWFVLFGIVVSLVLSPLSTSLSLLASLALLIPTVAVSVRRLHDTGRSGWFLLIYLIPFVGVIIVIVWLATEGEPGSNLYGESPKAGLV